MLGLLLIYSIGKYYYDLAETFGRNKWGYAISGVVAYYLGTFIGGILIVISLTQGSIDDINDYLLGLVALPFGLLLCWIVYKLLESRLERIKLNAKDNDILDGELL